MDLLGQEDIRPPFLPNLSDIADEYILTDSDQFTRSICDLDMCFDAVISRHNIEHCDHRS